MCEGWGDGGTGHQAQTGQPAANVGGCTPDCPVCYPKSPPKPDGDNAAHELSALMDRVLDVDIDAVTLRLFILAYWKRIAKLAHEIHDDRD